MLNKRDLKAEPCDTSQNKIGNNNNCNYEVRKYNNNVTQITYQSYTTA